MSEYLGKNLVIFFYKSNFGAKTPQEMNYLMERYEVFDKMKTKVAFCSPDKPFNHTIFAGKLRQLYGNECLKDMVILSDGSREIGQRYGVAEAGDTGANPKYLKGLIIIDKQGVLRYSKIIDAVSDRIATEVVTFIESNLCN